MFPTNHNGRTKLKAPSYMMLNPEQQHGPTSSFSVAHSYFQCKNPTHHISPICTLYAFRGSFPIYMDILHIIHNWDIDSMVAIAKRIRPTGRYISTDLMQRCGIRILGYPDTWISKLFWLSTIQILKKLKYPSIHVSKYP